jgi:hypothetical protein
MNSYEIFFLMSLSHNITLVYGSYYVCKTRSKVVKTKSTIELVCSPVQVQKTDHGHPKTTAFSCYLSKKKMNLKLRSHNLFI